ncbi:MAG: ABC transporter permease [Tabrizicola sp.]|nr:ABC transporter permease [Tabrizicola sp.]
MDYATLLQILDSTLRLATPLLLACLAGLFSERAGIFDIGLEGKMLAAAMASGAVAASGMSIVLLIPLTSVEVVVISPVMFGLIAGILASLLFALIHAVASITFRGNQLISGVALNFLASGITVLVAQRLFGQGGRTPPISGDARFNPITLPFAESLRDVPVLGPLYYEVISGHSALVYVALLAVPASWWVLYRTRFGLRLRAVGENPAAVDTAGISVTGLRYAAVALTGILCGLAGAYMATALQAGFGREMTAGRGYIALAALIFAKWRPVAALWACLLFGFFQALALRPDVVERVAGLKVPVPFLDALPYALTVIVLAGFIGRAIPPRAGGEAYVKER